MYSEAENRCDIVFADLLHAEGLSFSLADCQRFQLFFDCAKSVGPGYKLPSEKLVRTRLLDTNYRTYDEHGMKLLMKEANIYRVTYMGDGATISDMPLVNMICAKIADLLKSNKIELQNLSNKLQ